MTLIVHRLHEVMVKILENIDEVTTWACIALNSESDNIHILLIKNYIVYADTRIPTKNWMDYLFTSLRTYFFNLKKLSLSLNRVCNLTVCIYFFYLYKNINLKFELIPIFFLIKGARVRWYKKKVL